MSYAINLIGGPLDGARVVMDKEEKDVLTAHYTHKLEEVVGDKLYINNILTQEEHLFVKSTSENPVRKSTYIRMERVVLDDAGKVVERFYKYKA